jgi:hypothetical protein
MPAPPLKPSVEGELGAFGPTEGLDEAERPLRVGKVDDRSDQVGRCLGRSPSYLHCLKGVA